MNKAPKLFKICLKSSQTVIAMGFLNHVMTLEEVRYHILKCENNKSPGLENTPYVVLKCEDVI